MQFRELTISDYDVVIRLWADSSINLTLSDTKEELVRLIERNPSTCFVAEEEGKIIAAVCGSWDGRRGFVHHLAVDPGKRKLGIGRAMMNELERRFNSLGVVKMTFLVEQKNASVLEFYSSLGYQVRSDLIALSKTLRTK